MKEQHHDHTPTYPKLTALLLLLHRFFLQKTIFLSQGGKLSGPGVKDLAKEVNLLDNLRTIVGATARGPHKDLSRAPSPHRWNRAIT